MTDSRVRIPGIRWALAFIAAAMFALSWAPAAVAQQDDQYGGTVAPSGPAADAQCTVSGDSDGVVNAGDTVICEGEYSISEGASVTLQDSDGTQGTFVDGQNAEITEGSIIIEVASDPVGVVGGNGVLNTDGLFVVATTGISAAGTGADAGASAGNATASASTGDGASAQAGTGGGAGEDGAAVAVLPDTGGSIMAFVLAGGLLLFGAGFAVRRFAGSN